MKLRREIEEKYKWDLTKYFKNDEDWDKVFKKVKDLYEEVIKYEGKLNDDGLLFECLEKMRNANIIAERLFVYNYLKTCEDNANSFYLNKQSQIDRFYADISPRLTFIDSEINEFSDEKLNELINNKKFEEFNNTFKDTLRNKPHMLSKAEEKLLAKVGECLGGEQEVFDKFDAVDVEFEDVTDSKGNKYPLNNANYTLYIHSNDQKLRETAAKNINKPYAKINNTLASNYMTNVKTDCTFAKIRNYNSAFEMALKGADIDPKVYETLILNVNKNLDLAYRYYELKRKALKLDVMHTYDLYAKVAEIKTDYTYEESFELLNKALAPLGEDYLKVINRAKNERWIDVMPNKNKTTGAFQYGAYGVHPVVLINYENNINSTFILVHELGHLMHSYYTNKTQTYDKSHKEIFLDEVASTVNEMILGKYLLANAKTKEEKLFYIDHLMSEIYGTLYTQAKYAEFEYEIHKAYEAGEDTTPEAINNLYEKISKKYYGKKVELLDSVKYAWSIIPHFYNSFYVYKYATGIVSALAISNKILNGEKDALDNYKKFLSSGSSLPPVETLKMAGADLTNEKTFEDAFKFVSSLLDEWKSLENNKSQEVIPT